MPGLMRLVLGSISDIFAHFNLCEWACSGHKFIYIPLSAGLKLIVWPQVFQADSRLKLGWAHDHRDVAAPDLPPGSGEYMSLWERMARPSVAPPRALN